MQALCPTLCRANAEKSPGDRLLFKIGRNTCSIFGGQNFPSLTSSLSPWFMLSWPCLRAVQVNQNSKHILISVIWIEIGSLNPKLTEFFERVQRLFKNSSKHLYQKWHFAKKIIQKLSKKNYPKIVQKNSSKKLSLKLSKKYQLF